MKEISDGIAHDGGLILPMAGRRSPWGGNHDGHEDAGDTGESAESGSPEAESGAPGTSGTSRPSSAHDGPAHGPHDNSPDDNKSRGPRNPWLPPSDPPSRPRSANLEELLRPRKGAGASGGGNSGGAGGGGDGPDLVFRIPRRVGGKSWLPLIALGLVGLWVLGTSSHELGSTEQGIVTTFGKYSRTIGPGLSLTLPWPIEAVSVTNVTSIRRESIPEGDTEKLMLTSDQNLVNLSYLVRWSIRDLKLYTYQLNDPDAAVHDIAEAAMRASVAEVKLNDVMGGTGRAAIEQSVRQRMQAVLDAYRSGVLIQGVDIKKADPPDKVNDAFQQVSAAHQEANRDISRAQGFAQQVIARAQGDAAAFDKVYAQYKLAPEVTRRRMYYETMERVLSGNDKVIMEGNTTSYLPLPQIQHTSPQNSTANPGPGR